MGTLNIVGRAILTQYEIGLVMCALDGAAQESIRVDLRPDYAALHLRFKEMYYSQRGILSREMYKDVCHLPVVDMTNQQQQESP